MTAVPREKRALALFYKLTGEAWKDAEFLEQKKFKGKGGVKLFLQWIEDSYMTTKVSELGVVLTRFFRHLKRKQDEDVQTYKRAYVKGLAELREHGVNLPELVQAWFYIEKLAVNQDHELSLLLQWVEFTATPS